MSLEQAKQAVADLVAAIYPENLRQVIMNGYSMAPNAGDAAHWENIRKGLAAQAPQNAAKKAVADLVAVVYPENMRQMILDNFKSA